MKKRMLKSLKLIYSPIGIIVVGSYVGYIILFLSVRMHGCFTQPGDGLCAMGMFIPLLPLMILAPFIPMAFSTLSSITSPALVYLVLLISAILTLCPLYLIGWSFEYALKLKKSSKKYVILIPTSILILLIAAYAIATMVYP